MQSGALLGKGGTTINQIRSDSGATVRLIGLEPEEERCLPRETGPGQHRALCISGESNCVLHALSTVTDLLCDCQVPLPSFPSVTCCPPVLSAGIAGTLCISAPTVLQVQRCEDGGPSTSHP